MDELLQLNDEINVPLLRKTLEYVTEHPEEWRQWTWGARVSSLSCGTAGCFAHHAARLDGGELVGVAHVVAESEDPRHLVQTLNGRRVIHVAERAVRVLGLGRNAHGLFYAGNSLQDLRRIVDKLIREAEGG